MGVKAPLGPFPMLSTGTVRCPRHIQQLQKETFFSTFFRDFRENPVFVSVKSVLWKLELLVGDKPPMYLLKAWSISQQENSKINILKLK